MLKANEEPPLDEAPAFCPMKLMPEVIAKAIAEDFRKRMSGAVGAGVLWA